LPLVCGKSHATPVYGALFPVIWRHGVPVRRATRRCKQA